MIEHPPPLVRDLLSVRDLTVRFDSATRTTYAVNGVSFSVAPGETLGLAGESGSGKTVTSLAMMRLLAGTSAKVNGRVLLDDIDLLQLSESELRERRGRDIAMVFQDPGTSLNPVMTIGKHIMETIKTHRRVGRATARNEAIDLLARVGIPSPHERLDNYPHEFSGGMRQRVMIAMAVAMAPRLLVADEPTTALDVTIEAQVLDLLLTLTKTMGTAMILITHDLGIVAGSTERVAIMYAGRIVETGRTADVFDSPRHPYTVGLLHSVPRMGSGARRLKAIGGSPPDLTIVPEGCPFVDRCAWRLDICRVEEPRLVPFSASEAKVEWTGAESTHLFACHNPPTPEEARAGGPGRNGEAAK